MKKIILILFVALAISCGNSTSDKEKELLVKENELLQKENELLQKEKEVNNSENTETIDKNTVTENTSTKKGNIESEKSKLLMNKSWKYVTTQTDDFMAGTLYFGVDSKDKTKLSYERTYGEGVLSVSVLGWWEFSSDETSIIMKEWDSQTQKEKSPVTYKIIKLTATELIIELKGVKETYKL